MRLSEGEKPPPVTEAAKQEVLGGPQSFWPLWQNAIDILHLHFGINCTTSNIFKRQQLFYN